MPVEIKDVYDFLKRPPALGGAGTKPDFSSLQNSLLDGDFLEQLVNKLVESIGNSAKNLSPSLLNAGSKLTNEVNALASKNLTDVLQELVGDTPFSAMDLVSEVGKLSSQHFSSNFGLVKDKIKVVEHATKKLADLIGLPSNSPLFSDLGSSLTESLKLFYTGNPRALVTAFLTHRFAPSQSSASEIMNSMIAGKWLNWLQLPRALEPGAFYEWISDESKYHNASDPRLRQLELTYRTRLANAVATYLMSKSPGAMQGVVSSQRLSCQSLSDLIRTIVETTIYYVFEPENFDLYENGVDYYEDVCRSFCTGLAEQLEAQLRGTIGTLLRGAWEYSVHSDALAEIVSTVVATYFSNFLRGITTNLLSLIQLVPRYAGDTTSLSVIAPIASVERAEWKDGSVLRTLGIEYLLCTRSGSSLSSTKIGPTATKIINDFVAYIDMYHQTWRVTDEFKLSSANAARKIGVLQPRLQTKTLTVTATILGNASQGSPRPIMRAYFGDRSFLLRPTAQAGNSYVGEYEFFSPPLRSFLLHVTNSTGGYAQVSVNV